MIPFLICLNCALLGFIIGSTRLKFEWVTDRFWKRTVKDIRSKYKKIEVISGECRYNYRCHLNAMNDAIHNNEDEVAVVFYIDVNGQPITHIINYDGESYIDNTLGVMAQKYDFYLVAHIDKAEFFNMDNVLMRYKRMYKKTASIIERKFGSTIT